jgi:hypothetical protein
MFIDDNRPKNFYWLIKDNYHWKPDNIKPRIKWIKKHIARLWKNALNGIELSPQLALTPWVGIVIIKYLKVKIDY